MPETYIEPLTNRQECFTCHKTVTGKKKLSKCAKCEAITYCGQECQVEDWPRHKWNCLPVMVTEIEGKGRGLVAAKDIKMGELLFSDKAVIKVNSLEKTELLKPLMEQLNNLPSEARAQFHKLTIHDDREICAIDGPIGDILTITYQFFDNCKIRHAQREEEANCYYLCLNTILINHSCAPNVTVARLQPDNEFKEEVRAMKDISKGDEITVCDLNNHSILFDGFNRRIRREKIKNEFGFDCLCCVCSGNLPDQEDILMELRDLSISLAINSDHHQKKLKDWQREANMMDQVVELTKKLYIGDFLYMKLTTLIHLAKFAHLSRDETLLEKAFDGLNKLEEDSKMESFSLKYEKLKQDLSRWTSQFKSRKLASKDEIDSLCLFKLK